MSDEEKTITTGEGYGALRRDLIAAGFDRDEAMRIVMEYANADAHAGIGFSIREAEATA